MNKLFTLLIGISIAFQVSISVSAEENSELEGISITGNHELPNTLNIVPWRATEKLSDLNVTLPELTGHRTLEPIRRAEFMREVEYYYRLNPVSDVVPAANLSE